jgi:hypothetical protein
MKIEKGDQVVVRHALDGIIYTVESLYEERFPVAESVWKIIQVAELVYQSNGIRVGTVEPVSRLKKPTSVQLAAQG